jgi:uncharacterized protein YbjT (DUF2867 family)
MTDRIVTVFGASGRQGQAQVRALLAAGFYVRAISRNPEILQARDPIYRVWRRRRAP